MWGIQRRAGARDMSALHFVAGKRDAIEVAVEYQMDGVDDGGRAPLVRQFHVVYDLCVAGAGVQLVRPVQAISQRIWARK